MQISLTFTVWPDPLKVKPSQCEWTTDEKPILDPGWFIWVGGFHETPSEGELYRLEYKDCQLDYRII